jgi:hypothetical protein
MQKGEPRDWLALSFSTYFPSRLFVQPSDFSYKQDYSGKAAGRSITLSTGVLSDCARVNTL